MKSHSTNSSFMYVQIISKRQIQVYNESDETSNSPTTIRDTRRRYTTNANWNFVEIRKKQTKTKRRFLLPPPGRLPCFFFHFLDNSFKSVVVQQGRKEGQSFTGREKWGRRRNVRESRPLLIYDVSTK